MSESGQIENAIKFNISAFRSSGRLEYWKEKKDKASKIASTKKMLSDRQDTSEKIVSKQEANKKIREFWKLLYDPHFDEPNKEATGLLAWREKAKIRYDSALDERSDIANLIRHHDEEIRNTLNKAKRFIANQGQNIDETQDEFINLNASFDELISMFGGKL